MMKYSKYVLMGLMAMTLAAQTQPAPAQPAAPAEEPGLYATIDTNMGAIKVQLFEKETPITVKNFVDLELGRKPWRDPKTGQWVRRPLYNGTIFHRVIPKFMIQGGDPAGTGMGSPGFTIPDEFLPGLKFDKPGRLAMANIGTPHTGGCQFFITVAQTPWLNGHHTIFGQVVSGQEVADKISNLPKNADDKPLKPVVIRAIKFSRVGPAPAKDVLAPPQPAAKKAAPKK
jgi:peptidyl-prolyl cis-trans isomerase A (cyclophilin A)